MSLRYGYLALIVAGLAIQSGCRCYTNQPWPCGGTYCGTQCGCFYWHEWFSHKPCCCEPCDFCGNFTASSNPYVKSGPPRTPYGAVYDDGSGTSAPGAAGQLYPTPAEAEPVPSPPADELLPETTSAPRRSGGPSVSRVPVESAGGSRTLGKPPRTRLFSR